MAADRGFRGRWSFLLSQTVAREELVARRARRSRRVAACVGADLEQQKAGRGAVRELEAAARARRRAVSLSAIASN